MTAAHRPSEAPRIWGAEMRPWPPFTGRNWGAAFGEMSCTVSELPNGKAECYVGDTRIKYGSVSECAGAIETELTRIETAIRTTREGAK